jgi:predicted transcriptional regulator
MERTLTIRLDPETARLLDAESRATRRSKGEVVRRVLRERLRRRRTSALDALAQFVGVMEGPADLSTHKRHLRTFGRGRTRR